MHKYYNPNPDGKNVGDCVIRAIAKALDIDWEQAYIAIVLQGYIMHDMPSANAVWGAYLRVKGYRQYNIDTDNPDYYTLADFAADNPKGKYIVALSSHVVCVIDGDWYDTWDSGGEIPLYFWGCDK